MDVKLFYDVGDFDK